MPRFRHSITHIRNDDLGHVVVTGSHGGAYSAAIAAKFAPAGVVFHDAGVGLDDAGIAGLALLDEIGIPAAAVDFRTARIGDALDIFERGVISHVNDAAFAMGVRSGHRSSDTCRKLGVPHGAPSGTIEGHAESRRRIDLEHASPVVWALDSASLVVPEDALDIVVTGSHGGLVGGDPARALGVDALLAAFNDGGVGIDEAGISRLSVLERRGIAAITVSYMSARIGCALSSWETGCISFANAAASAAGARPGQPLRELLCDIVRRTDARAYDQRKAAQ